MINAGRARAMLIADQKQKDHGERGAGL